MDVRLFVEVIAVLTDVVQLNQDKELVLLAHFAIQTQFQL